MKTNVVQLEGIKAEQLLKKLEAIDSNIKALDEKFKPQFATEYLTRQEVAELLKVSLVTVHDWTNKQILQRYKIANKVRYIRREVEQALKPVR